MLFNKKMLKKETYIKYTIKFIPQNIEFLVLEARRNKQDELPIEIGPQE